MVLVPILYIGSIVTSLLSSKYLAKTLAKFSDMDASMASEVKSMTRENRHLKCMYAKMGMQNDLLNDEEKLICAHK